MRVLFPGGIEIFGNVGFCGGKKTREPGEKPSEQDKNQQQTQPTCDACSLGPFLEGLEKFSHPESRCKTLWLQSRFIHILLIWTELRSLYTRSLRHRIHLSDFRYRLIKNGPKSFRGFWETSPWSGNRSRATLVGDECSHHCANHYPALLPLVYFIKS